MNLILFYVGVSVKEDISRQTLLVLVVLTLVVSMLSLFTVMDVLDQKATNYMPISQTSTPSENTNNQNQELPPVSLTGKVILNINNGV